MNGVLADTEPLRNGVIVRAGRDQPKNQDLSWRQTLPVFGWKTWRQRFWYSFNSCSKTPDVGRFLGPAC
jgi:hypothetical protein